MQLQKFISATSIFILLMQLSSCKKAILSTVTTSIIAITDTTAQCGGIVESDGGSDVTARGVVWSQMDEDLSIESHHSTIDGSGLGNFTSDIPDLYPGLKYYVQAYATNSVGTAYSNKISFTTLPVLWGVSGVTSNSITLNCYIQSHNEYLVTCEFEYGTTISYGKVVPATQSPLIVNVPGQYVDALVTGLAENTKYHFRIKTNSLLGTFYSKDMTFSTLNAEQVTDIEGNIYNSVTIGTQVWMTENLRVTKFNDGISIPMVEDLSEWISKTSPVYCWYNNDEATYKNIYGALYNWYTIDVASNGGKNVCPTGWHVPTDEELAILNTYLGGDYVTGGKLKEFGSTHWDTYNVGATNETGFSALPGGLRFYSQDFTLVGSSCYLWTTTVLPSFDYDAWVWSIGHDGKSFYKGLLTKINGASVRCLRD